MARFKSIGLVLLAIVGLSNCMELYVVINGCHCGLVGLSRLFLLVCYCSWVQIMGHCVAVSEATTL